MDKVILDKLIKFGLITNINVDPNKYKDVNDLINKGVVTIPGAKTKIMELLENEDLADTTSSESITEVHDIEPVTVVDTPEDVIPIDETPKSPEVIDETPVEEAPIEEIPVEEPTVVEEAPAEEVVETVEATEETPVEETTKKKKSTKKTEQAK